MDVIQTKQGPEIKIFYNLVDCKHRGNCYYQEEREAELKKKYPSTEGRCYFNPSIFECEAYQKFNRQLGVQKIKDMRCL